MGRKVYQLYAKLVIVSDVIARANKLERFTLPGLAKRLGMTYGALKACWSRGTLTAKQELAICAAAGFSRNEISWFDPDADENTPIGKRRDTPIQFQEMLSAKSPRSNLEHRRAKNDSQPKMLDPRTLVFSVDSGRQNVRSDVPMSLFLTVTAEPGMIDRYMIGYHKIRIKLTFEDITGALVLARSGHPDAVLVGNAQLLATHTPEYPGWSLVVDQPEGVLFGEYNVPQPLIQLSGLRLGEVVVAEVLIYQLDRALVSLDETKTADRVLEKLYKILERKRIDPDGPRDAWLVLGRQRILISQAERP